MSATVYYTLIRSLWVLVALLWTNQQHLPPQMIISHRPSVALCPKNGENDKHTWPRSLRTSENYIKAVFPDFTSFSLLQVLCPMHLQIRTDVVDHLWIVVGPKADETRPR